MGITFAQMIEELESETGRIEMAAVVANQDGSNLVQMKFRKIKVCEILENDDHIMEMIDAAAYRCMYRLKEKGVSMIDKQEHEQGRTYQIVGCSPGHRIKLTVNND